MKPIHLLCFLLPFLFPIGSAGQGAPNRPLAPDIPGGAVESARRTLTQTAVLLSKGQFDQATAFLKAATPGPVVRVYVDWTPIPRNLRADYRQAVESGLAEWNAALGPARRFETAAREEEADVVVLFDRTVTNGNLGPPQFLCLDTPVAEDAQRSGLTANPQAVPARPFEIRISLLIPHTTVAHRPNSIQHLVEQGLGASLGLAATKGTTDVMGLDMHGPNVAVKLSAEEIECARRLQAARTALLDFAARRVAVSVPLPVLAFDKIEVDSGEIWRGETAHFVFKYRNNGSGTLEIDAHPTCGCTVARFDRSLPPGKEGKIEADLKTAAFRGKIVKYIEIRSNDLSNQNVNLSLVATVKSVFQILPTEMPLIGLKVSGPTEYEFQVKASDTEPVQIKRIVTSAPYVSATAEPVGGPDNAFKIKVKIEPGAPMGRSAFALTAETTSKREPQLQVLATCEKGIMAMPPSAFMGSIGPATTLPVRQIITLIRRSVPFHITKVESEDPKIQVEQKAIKEGEQYVLTLRYMGGWSPGVIERKILVLTDDPLQPRIEIPVRANVIAAVGASQ